MAESETELMPNACLFLEDGDRIYRVHVNAARLTIGRSEKNDIVVKSKEMEAEHAEISFLDPHFVLSTSASIPPSVNGKILEGPRRLYNGDVINIAGNIMTFVKVPAISDTVVQLALWGAGEEPYFLLLSRPEFTLGHAKSDLRIADEFLGSPHCTIENFCAGVQFIVPIDEERGVLIDGSRIQRRTRLQDGDVLTLGSTEVAVRLHPRRSLPSPTESLPLDGVRRARVAEDLQGEGDLAKQSGSSERVQRRRMREILQDASRDGQGMVELVDGFDEEDNDGHYYLPDDTGRRRPVRVDARMEEEAGDGHTMVLQVDEQGKAKKERYYMPDGEESGRVQERDAQMEREGSRQTRMDIPQADGDEPEEA
jgi:pSer/pThr/pTyr-binding forkhead associated (FHA) protein